MCSDASLQQLLTPTSSVGEIHCGPYQLPASEAVSTMATASPVMSPCQMRLVPIVYLDEDGTPICYEVVKPVPSPSYFTRSTPSAG